MSMPKGRARRPKPLTVHALVGRIEDHRRRLKVASEEAAHNGARECFADDALKLLASILPEQRKPRAKGTRSMPPLPACTCSDEHRAEHLHSADCPVVRHVDKHWKR